MLSRKKVLCTDLQKNTGFSGSGLMAETDRRNDGYAVPDTLDARERCRAAVQQYVAVVRLVPPLSMEDLRTHADRVINLEHLDSELRDFVMVLLSNEVWRDTVAGIPYERRILLLPQCLRSMNECVAERDEFGLICAGCGSCHIGELQALAEELGYVVLVAEGSTVVSTLLEQGKIDAVIGVSCLDALEKSFPATAANAIPGIAVPLVIDGCIDTDVDVSWVRDAITLASDNGWTARFDLDVLHDEVKRWFAFDKLVGKTGGTITETERLALDWVAKAGKRWRPMLVASVYKALRGVKEPVPESVKCLAVAVECFHKASLVHDDIEDDDELRYDAATLHCKHGMPIALNIGDLLLGEGYQLVANCGLPPERTVQITSVAAEAHRTLCLGQGEELTGMQGGEPLSSQTVIDIFRWKTSPAFDVSVQLGAIAAGCDENLSETLGRLSDALGVAYQIRDDLDDMRDTESEFKLRRIRPSLVYSLAYEHADDATKLKLARAWRNRGDDEKLDSEIRDILTGSGAVEKAELLFEHYKNQTVRALNPLQNVQLKTLLRRVVGKMLGGV